MAVMARKSSMRSSGKVLAVVAEVEEAQLLVLGDQVQMTLRMALLELQLLVGLVGLEALTGVRLQELLLVKMEVLHSRPQMPARILTFGHLRELRSRCGVAEVEVAEEVHFSEEALQVRTAELRQMTERLPETLLLQGPRVQAIPVMAA